MLETLTLLTLTCTASRSANQGRCADWLSIDLKLSLRGDVDGVRHRHTVETFIRSCEHSTYSTRFLVRYWRFKVQSRDSAGTRSSRVGRNTGARLLGALEAVAEGSQAWPTGEQGRTEVIDCFRQRLRDFQAEDSCRDTRT